MKSPVPAPLLLFALCCLPALAPAQEDELWTANLFFENDLFANSDQDYTNGVRASLISPDLTGYLEIQGQGYGWVDRLNRWLQPLHPDPEPGEGQQVNRNVALSFGQLIFTPQDRDRASLDPDDRPYAGWLYTGLGYHARTSRTLHSMEFNLGMVGPAALGEEVQDLVHDIRDIPDFQGWDNQLKNEPGFQLVFERKHRLEPFGLGLAGLQSDFITHVGASLGNIHTYANAGAEFRLGWNLPPNFGVSNLRPGGDNNVPAPYGEAWDRELWRVHGFINSDLRLVLHNIFLDGNTFRDSHSVDKKHLVGDIAAGITVSKGRWKLTYSQVYRTRTFELQEEPQSYGSLSLSYHFRRDL